MMETAIRRIGFIGLGVMGRPICRNIARKSRLPTTAFDLNPEPLHQVEADGVSAACSVVEVTKNADVILLSLPGGPQVEAVVTGPNGILSAARNDQIIVDLSTTPVDVTRAVARACTDRGIAFADAPVARTRQAAEDGTLSIMVGAPSHLFNQIEPFLTFVATDVTHCGPVGCGQIAKIMNNMILTQIVVALSEALAIGTAAGIDGHVLYETLSKGSADSFALRNHGMKAILPGKFPREAFSTLYAMKDLDCALALARDGQIDARGAIVARQLLSEANAAGFGQEYFPVVSKIIERKSGGAAPERET